MIITSSVPAFTPIPNPKTPKPDPSDLTRPDSLGIPSDDIQTLSRFKSRHNQIRVLQISRAAAPHPLAGARLLLLDTPGNIHSLSFPFCPPHSLPLSSAYFDVFATLPAVLPPGPLGVFGFGAGTAARLVLECYPTGTVHGWEIDGMVVDVGREYFDLRRVERRWEGRLFVNVGDALKAEVENGFAGILVDLFSKGCLLPELQDPMTWRKMKGKLREGGRVMVNVGGSCVEPEDKQKDGRVIMEETLEAMSEGFGDQISILSLGNNKDDSSIALTGKLLEAEVWRKGLPKALRFYVDMWSPFTRISKH